MIQKVLCGWKFPPLESTISSWFKPVCHAALNRDTNNAGLRLLSEATFRRISEFRVDEIDASQCHEELALIEHEIEPEVDDDTQ